MAYFLSSSMSIEQRRATEESLLGLYYETLKAGGVEGYSLEDLHRDFQAGLGAPLTTWVIAGGMLDFSDERGSDLFKRCVNGWVPRWRIIVHILFRRVDPTGCRFYRQRVP